MLDGTKRMKIPCVDGHWHDVSPTALALILAAYASGELQKVTKHGVVNLCVATAFSNERVRDFRQRWPGHLISIDKRIPDAGPVILHPSIAS